MHKITTASTCIIARRLPDGRVQYGSGGVDGVIGGVARKLLKYYDKEDAVGYLFRLGQLRYMGKPGSRRMYPAGEPHRIGDSENALLEAAGNEISHYSIYLYEADGCWYYILPGAINIKVPLAVPYRFYGPEAEFRGKIETRVVRHLVARQPEEDPGFAGYMDMLGAPRYGSELLHTSRPMFDLAHSFMPICRYYDNWVLVYPDEDGLGGIGGILFREREQTHTETVYWRQEPEEKKHVEGPYRNRYVKDRVMKAYAEMIYSQLLRCRCDHDESEILKIVPKWFYSKIRKAEKKKKVRRILERSGFWLWRDEVSGPVMKRLVKEAEKQWGELLSGTDPSYKGE